MIRKKTSADAENMVLVCTDEAFYNSDATVPRRQSATDSDVGAFKSAGIVLQSGFRTGRTMRKRKSNHAYR